MGIHDGHRGRMREEFLQSGLDGFTDVHALEFFLSFSRPRGDTNPLAHELLRIFGSLAGVLDASPEALAKVPGIGDNSVALIKLFTALYARYMSSRSKDEINGSTLEGLWHIFSPHFFGAREEKTFLACFDNTMRLLGVQKISEGSPSASDINLRKLVSTALTFHATVVVLAHNHPSGDPTPSDADIDSTKYIKQYLQPLGIQLHDHVILTDDNITSMRHYIQALDIPRY